MTEKNDPQVESDSIIHFKTRISSTSNRYDLEKIEME